MLKNVANQIISVRAWKNGSPFTADASQITAVISLDGAAAVATNDVNPSPVSNIVGLFIFNLTQAETNAAHISLEPSTTETDVTLTPVEIYTEAAPLTAQQVWEYATRSLTDKTNFELIAAYNPAKSAAQAGDAMALITGAITASKIAAGALSGKGDWNTVTPDNEGIVSTLEGILSANAALSGVLTILALLSKLARADVRLDTTTTPWTEKYYEKGTATLLMTKVLYDENGNGITSIDSYIGRRMDA